MQRRAGGTGKAAVTKSRACSALQLLAACEAGAMMALYTCAGYCNYLESIKEAVEAA
jgi:hypothetical protein